MESTGAAGVAALDRPPWLLAAGADAVWQAGGGVVGFRELRRSLG
jgi:ribulose 1,5-bisphosphate carboxylase large subunit-like protein